MKITFLGVSGALSAKYNSNMLIEENDQCMLFDCGEDVMHSLDAAGRKPEELDAVYISHLHFDHCGGLSWLGYYTYFISKKKLKLFIHESMVSDLWAILRPAMEKLDGQDKMMTLTDYFDVIVANKYSPYLPPPHFLFANWKFNLIQQLHVKTSCGNMYSYGLIGVDEEGKKRAYISSDAKRVSILSHEYDYIFCDCDVMNLNAVHPNYNDLEKFSDEIKEKMWLYHYSDLGDKMPDAVADGFAGFVKQGQIFEI